MERVNIYDQISGNKRMSYILFIIFFIIAFILSYIISAYFGGGYIGIGAILIFAVIWMLFSYYLGDKAILAINHAKEVRKQEYPHLYNTVEGLSIAAGIPMPKIYVIDDPSPNAFATGRDPRHSSVAVTKGLLDIMNRQELEGVLAHELSHIKNYDIRYMTLVMVMIGLIGILSNILVRMFLHGRGNRRGGGKGGAVIILIGILFAIIAPIIAQMVRFAISRKREYLADASGALLTRYPPGLASALRKISANKIPMTKANPDSAPLYIANPFREGFFDNLFSTHPPAEKRIKALEAM
ncbi:MAG: M48 family metallopeptidase [Candidatus Altiarchaeota archaeon]|nr:M48 family metallopeptidase [Candidatus Altiarchaeota archaeon]